MPSFDLSADPPGAFCERLACRRFYAVHVGVPFLLAVILLFGFESTSLDRQLSDVFFDPGLPGFPLRHDWFLETVVHRWARYLLVGFALMLAAMAVAGFWLPSVRRQSRVLWFLILAMGLGPAAVGMLKQVTNKHCPYDLAVYGGEAPHVRLWERAPPGGRAGECFPGGHASGGFGLMAFYFIWYRRRPRRARAALAIGFTFGFALGWGRVMQGAHFLSHNLWAALVCWSVAVLLYRLLLHGRSGVTGNA